MWNKNHNTMSVKFSLAFGNWILACLNLFIASGFTVSLNKYFGKHYSVRPGPYLLNFFESTQNYLSWVALIIISAFFIVEFKSGSKKSLFCILIGNILFFGCVSPCLVIGGLILQTEALR
jgi:hypothetical protein